jgi:hypothetical protein
VTISKETTYLTEPLRPDGYVDYIAALNRQHSRGVTPTNNAAVLFIKAVGPAGIKPGHRAEYFRLLGIPPLPDTGDYYVPFDAFAKSAAAKPRPAGQKIVRQEELMKQYLAASGRPWSREELPLLAEWLAANEKPLALAVEASKRPRFFDPLVPEGAGTMVGASRETMRLNTDLGRGLVLRALLRLGEGQTEEAWADLLACQRFARLVGQGPMLIDALVAVVIEGLALSGDQALLENAPLTAARALRMREELGKLPPMPKMVDAIDGPERYMFLDCVAAVARGESPMFEWGVPEEGPLESLRDPAARSAIDWDLVLRMGNGWYDRSADVLRQPTRARRRAAAAAITEDIEARAQEAKSWKSLALDALINRREGMSRRIGLALIALMLPATHAAGEAADRSAMNFEATRLGFALAAYRADHGAFPARLADLVPKYAAEIPKDLFADADLRYKLDGSGCLVYSVGSNGKDDGGKGHADRKDGEDWDDLAVRLPAARGEKGAAPARNAPSP